MAQFEQSSLRGLKPIGRLGSLRHPSTSLRTGSEAVPLSKTKKQIPSRSIRAMRDRMLRNDNGVRGISVRGGWKGGLGAGFGEGGGEGVERERAEQVATQAGVDLVEGVAGALDPGEGQRGGQAAELGAEIDVAHQFRRSGVEQEQIFEQQREGAQQRGSLLLAVGAGAVGLGHLEEGGVVEFWSGTGTHPLR